MALSAKRAGQHMASSSGDSYVREDLTWQFIERQ